MRNCYLISRIVICAMSVILSLIAFRNEHITLKVGGTVIISTVTCLSTFLSTPICKKMINIGDGIDNIGFRILYYFGLFPLILLIVFLLWLLIQFLYEKMEHSPEFGMALGQALMTLFLGVSVFILFMVPYIQTLIVLIFRTILKGK